MRILRKLAAILMLIMQLATMGNAMAQAMPATIFNPTSVASGWSYDPAKDGMRDLFEMMPIEGCNAPGGLSRITDRDEADSAPFWCGPPPHCLAEGTNGVDACTFVQYCRREPRGDPNGISGGNGCRDPEDLRCVSSGAPPEGGQCLKTCWDGSRILFSSACPPQTVCSTDALGATSCTTIYDTPPSAPPRTPPGYTPPPVPTPTPTPTPTPILDPCAGGSGPYGACFFNWGNAQSGQNLAVASSNGVNGILRGTCTDGSWSIDELNCDTPTHIVPICPNGSPAPATGICPIPGPAPLFENCNPESFTQGTCTFNFNSALHGQAASVPANAGGGTGTMSAICADGKWIDRVATCVPNNPPIPNCADGSPAPAWGCMKTCPDGVSWIPETEACPLPQTCWNGWIIPANQVCPPETKTCWDGTVIPVSQACPEQTKTCPDGTVIPVSAACAPPPPPMKTCWDGTVIPVTASCSTPPPPPPCTTSYHYVAFGYGYCTKKPEFAGTYQNSMDASSNFKEPTVAPPTSYANDLALIRFHVAVSICENDPNPVDPQIGIQMNPVVDAMNADYANKFCLHGQYGQ